MPAYRSDAEAEIRDAVVEKLRRMIPDCRIIHEINAFSFGNRIDVLAVGRNRIAAVEIKSEKDKIDRLPDQVAAMRRVTDLSFAALHEKFLRQIDGLGFTTPDEADRATVWIYPKINRPGHVECGSTWFDRARWSKPKLCLPPSAIEVLWRDELHSICRSIGLSGVSKLTMEEAIDAIRWHMSGAEITRAICAALRSRNCVEADPAILEEAA